MSGTLQIKALITTGDPSQPSASQIQESVGDAVASTHDLVDPLTPMSIATGTPGVSFVQVPLSVAHIERLAADLGASSDVVLRLNGAAAFVVGNVTAPSLAGGDTLVLAVDSGAQVTTTFAGTENTIAKVAGAIAAAFIAAGLANPASVDAATGGLRLSGVKSGDQAANAKGWQSGAVEVVSGAAVAKLGLTVAKTWATGDDDHVSGVLFKSFPASSLPTRLEVSGTASNAKFIVAGKAT